MFANYDNIRKDLCRSKKLPQLTKKYVKVVQKNYHTINNNP